MNELEKTDIQQYKSVACKMIDKIIKRLEEKTGLDCDSIELYYINEDTDEMATDISLSVRHLRDINK